jgi:hypothetical protein
VRLHGSLVPRCNLLLSREEKLQGRDPWHFGSVPRDFWQDQIELDKSRR